MLVFDKKTMRMLSLVGPNGAYGISANEVSSINEKAVFLTADLCSYSGLDNYKKQYPDNLFNFGIAEQNMIGAAAGLAKEGLTPFVSTYASFCCSRCADQIRVCMSYMKLPIKVVGLNGGYSAGILGATHMSIEDVSFFRSLPNLVVVSPADCTEVVKAMIETSKTDDPTYIRLTGPINTPLVYSEDYNFKIGVAITLKEGNDVCIMATGSMVYHSMKAAELLEEDNVSCSVVNIHTIKPLDVNYVKKASEKHKLIVCVEEHNMIGGLFSAVSEVIAQEIKQTCVVPIGVKDQFVDAGDYYFQLEKSGLTSAEIAKTIKKKLNG